MGLGIPPLKSKILLESNPLKSMILVRRLTVAGAADLPRAPERRTIWSEVMTPETCWLLCLIISCVFSFISCVFHVYFRVYFRCMHYVHMYICIFYFYVYALCIHVYFRVYIICSFHVYFRFMHYAVVMLLFVVASLSY